MKKLTGYIFLVFLFLGGFCAFTVSRSIDTAANLAAQELQRPPASSEVIAESLDRRLYVGEEGGPLVFLGWLFLIVLAVGGLFGYYWLKAKFLRQKRLTYRAMNQPNAARRIPRITIPTSRQLGPGEEEGDYDQYYR